MDVYLQPVGSDTTLKIWPRSDELPQGSIQENVEYRLVVSGLPDPDSISVSVDGEPLQALRSPTKTSAAFLWNPGYFAGTIDLEVDSGTGSPTFISIVIDPSVAKLHRNDYNLMVGQILEDTLALFSFSPVRFSVSRGNHTECPPIARLVYLQSVMESIECDLREIDKDPVRALGSNREIRPIHLTPRVRGIDLTRSYRFGQVIPISPSSRIRPGVRFVPARVEIFRKAEHFTVPEHAIIKGFLVAAGDWLDVAAFTLKRAASATSSPRTFYRWSGRCKILADRCRQLQQLSFLRDVEPKLGSLRLGEAFRRRAPYARVMKAISDWRVGISRISGPFLQLPLSKTYELYEFWAYLRIVRAAVKYFRATSVDTSELLTTDVSNGRIQMRSKSTSIQLGTGIRLTFQRSYREYWKESGGVGSFSREMIPDVAIELPNRNGVIVFDAKYRLEAGLLDSVSSIHMYRDAILQTNPDVTTSRAVRAAYLVAPTLPSNEPEDWKESGMPARLFHPEYRKEFRFGAISMHPRMTDAEIGTAVEMVLADCAGDQDIG